LIIFWDIDKYNISKDQAKKEYNEIKSNDSWGSHYTFIISGLAFNISIVVYVEDGNNYLKRYIYIH